MKNDPTSVSIVVIADYGGRNSEDWDYLRDTLRGLRDQSGDWKPELLLVDQTPPGESMPDDIQRILEMRVIAGPLSTRELMNEAVRAASGDVLALIDGDCAPVPGWLSAGIDALRARSDAVAVSGRTLYPMHRLSFRVLATLSRSFLDPGGPGRTKFISNNNAIYWRKVLLDHPLGDFPRPMATRLQAEAIRAAGGGLYFEPRMEVTHRFEGWPMEKRIRRRIGYRAIRVRQLDPRVPYAWMLRFGIASIPLVLGARILESCWNCVRAGRFYGLRWFELPIAFATAVYVHMFEIGGMLDAFHEGRAQAASS